MSRKTIERETKTAVKGQEDFKIDLSIPGIKKFIDFAGQFKISSLSLGAEGKKITVTQNITSAPLSQNASIPEPAAELEYKPESYEKIKSKFIGSFHSVKGIAAGSAVKKGQTVAKIFSMKIEHEVKADKDCTLKKVLVKENEPIDYGRPLFFIE